jgi:hypothetical protein
LFDCRVRNTLNTVRIEGYNHRENAIKVTDIAYAASHPNAIILVTDEKWQEAFAATPLIHHPRNAPILFTSRNNLDTSTLSQIIKLNPMGIDGVKVFLVGGISYSIEEQLNRLDFGTLRIDGKDIYELTANISRYLNYPQNIFIISSEDYMEGMSVCAYAAHSGAAILFTEKHHLPWYTKYVIQMTEDPKVFIVGSPYTVSEDIEDEIRRLNVKFIDRISGVSPYEVSVNFAKYRDPEDKFGWGRTYRDGHGFTFISICSPFDAPGSATLAHLGKHAPILTIDPNYLPNITKEYLESIRPIPPSEPRPPFMHGWLIGCNNIISYEAQLQIESTLSIDMHH